MLFSPWRSVIASYLTRNLNLHLRACTPRRRTANSAGARLQCLTRPRHRAETARPPLQPALPVPKLRQNPIYLGGRELLFEREQLPQVVDNKHFRIELIEHLELV